MTDVAQIIAGIETRKDRLKLGATGFYTEGDWQADRALVDEVRRLEGHVELLQSKIDAEKSCACSYDTPDDVCATHSPKLAAAEAELARLRAPQICDCERGHNGLGIAGRECDCTEEVRLRTPVGEVGEVVGRLEVHPWGLVERSITNAAADLITRLAAEIERLSETWVDETGLCWSPPTAWAYAKVCKARSHWRARATTAEASLREAVEVIERARNVLNNMAQEHEGAIFNRWPIHHEPLRADAKNVVPVIDAFTAKLEPQP